MSSAKRVKLWKISDLVPGEQKREEIASCRFRNEWNDGKFQI